MAFYILFYMFKKMLVIILMIFFCLLQTLNRHDPSYNELNDAVYMESQAFLMHEIMNDGMAFCSVM